MDYRGGLYCLLGTNFGKLEFVSYIYIHQIHCYYYCYCYCYPTDGHFYIIKLRFMPMLKDMYKNIHLPLIFLSLFHCLPSPLCRACIDYIFILLCMCVCVCLYLCAGAKVYSETQEWKIPYKLVYVESLLSSKKHYNCQWKLCIGTVISALIHAAI